LAPSPTAADGDDYFNGYNSDQCAHKVGGEISLHSVPSKESMRSGNRSINTIHSGKSYRSEDESPSHNRSNRSNRSGRSLKRQMKSKRIEKRREWLRRHERRRVVVGHYCTRVVQVFVHHLLIISHLCSIF
jgi:hypothetical protein